MDDNVTALTAGFAGTAVTTALLVAIDAVLPIDVAPFDSIAALIGFPDAVALGFLVFVLFGTVAWSSLFASIGRYLPGGTDPVRGMVFSVVLWVGFATAFAGTAPGELALYLVFTLLVHLAYGLTLGTVYSRLADHDMQTV